MPLKDIVHDVSAMLSWTRRAHRRLQVGAGQPRCVVGFRKLLFGFCVGSVFFVCGWLCVGGGVSMRMELLLI